MWPLDQNDYPMYQQYSHAYDTGNYNSIDAPQAFGHIQQFMADAPDDIQQQLYMQYFSQMPHEQRALLAQRMPPQYTMNSNDPWSMSQSFWRLGREKPYLVPQILDHPILLAVGVGLAGLIAKHVLQRHHHSYGQQPYGYDQGDSQQDQYSQQELDQARQREQQLQYEIQNEKRKIEQLEERERRDYRHHHREDDF